MEVNDPGGDQGDDLLWRHLKSVPAFRALLRATEARLFQDITIEEPSLDLGCGDGHFADIGLTPKITAGIDPWWGPLKKAFRTPAYRFLTQGSGGNLPFPDSYFQTVFSNSVLEHIPVVQPVLDETYRILRPGGIMIFTTPSDQFTRRLQGAKLLERVRFNYGAERYRSFFNRISRHYHTDSPETWLQRLKNAGFQAVKWQYYFSEKALHTLELGHIQGLPSAVIHALTGHWIVAPWKSSLGPTEQWLRPFYDEDPPDLGTMMIFVAKKLGQNEQ